MRLTLILDPARTRTQTLTLTLTMTLTLNSPYPGHPPPNDAMAHLCVSSMARHQTLTTVAAFLTASGRG